LQEMKNYEVLEGTNELEGQDISELAPEEKSS
jgi:Fe-S cluster assembly ATPase SufC